MNVSLADKPHVRPEYGAEGVGFILGSGPPSTWEPFPKKYFLFG